MRTAGSVFAAFVTASAASLACAADQGRGVWYVLPSYHQAGLDKATLKFRQGTTETKVDSTFGDDTAPGLAVGYAFQAPYRVDVEYQSQDNDLKARGVKGSSLQSTTAAIDLWRDFGPWHGLRAYVGVGAGGGRLELDKLDSNVYLGRLGAGMAWYFTRRMALDIGYRYQFATSKPELSSGTQKVTTDYTGQSVQIGLRFDF